MLIIAKDKEGKKIICSRLADDGMLEQATEIARSIVLHNRKVRRTYVYLKDGKGKPVLLRKVSVNWLNKVIIKCLSLLTRPRMALPIASDLWSRIYYGQH